MTDLNLYLMNKDHNYIGGPTTGPVIAKASGVHLIGINPPPVSTIEDNKAPKIAKIKPSMSRERVGLNPNQLLINLQNYNFK